jgi:MFS transporter, DHA1 family, multidrug resistance protein
LELFTLKTMKVTKRLRTALLLGSLAALGPLTIDMYLPSFPTIASEYGTTASLVQISLTACLLGIGLGQLIIGPMSDVIGRRKPLLIFLALYFIASVACAFAPNITVFIATRFMQGFSAAAGLVLSRAIVRDLYSGRELTKFFALIMLINNMAPILAPIAGAGILTFTDWSGVFLVLGAVGILLLLIVTSRLKETLAEDKRVPNNIGETFKSFFSLIRNRTFAGYALTQSFMVAGIFAYVSGTPFVYQNIYGASPQDFSLLFGMNGIGIMIGTQLVGLLNNRVSETRFLQIGLMISSTAGFFLLLAILLHGPLLSIVIPIFFFVASIGIISTSSFSLAMQEQGHIAGSAAALLGLLPFVLGSITAPLVGIAGENTAIPMGVTMFTAGFLSLTSYLILVRGSKKSQI